MADALKVVTIIVLLLILLWYITSRAGPEYITENLVAGPAGQPKCHQESFKTKEQQGSEQQGSSSRLFAKSNSNIGTRSLLYRGVAGSSEQRESMSLADLPRSLQGEGRPRKTMRDPLPRLHHHAGVAV